MIRRIRLRNFMSHSDTVIELAEGLTVLLGPNNCGKSAIVAALQAICENTRGEFMVRHGEREAHVIVETDDGHTIEWIRKRATASYVLDGTRIDRGQTPEKLHDLLRLAQVTTPDGRESFDVHFGVQKSPIFLLDQPPSRAAMFFASSSDASKLMEMQRLHKQKVQEKRREENRLTLDVERLQKNLTALEPVADIQKAVQTAERLRGEWVASTASTATLQQELVILEAQERSVASAEERAGVLAPLQAPPTMDDTRSLADLLDQVGRSQGKCSLEEARRDCMASLLAPPLQEDTCPLDLLCQALQTQGHRGALESARSSVLSPLAPPPPILPVDPLEEACRNLESQDGKVCHLRAQAAALVLLPEVPEQHDVKVASAFIHNFESGMKAFQSATSVTAILAKLPPLPAIEEVDPHAAFLETLSEAEQLVQTHREDFRTTQADLEKAAEALQSWAESNPACPTCGAVIDPDHLLTGGGHDHAQV